MNFQAQVHDHKERILVVEDDAEIINLHLDFLSDYFTVDIESSGIQAITNLKKNRNIHLALIDLILPDISGIEVLREIKKIMPFIPAIIITAFGNEDVAVKAFRCGARDYVKKPFSYDELIKRIKFCLSLNVIEQDKHRKALTNESEEFPGHAIDGAKTTVQNYRIQKALKYIHNNYSTDISLDRIANAVSLSKYHFSRLFKEATGFSYLSYLNRVRIEQAKKLLNDDALSITDAGHCVGYANLTHFERIFKKVVGINATQYKNQRSDSFRKQR